MVLSGLLSFELANVTSYVGSSRFSVFLSVLSVNKQCCFSFFPYCIILDKTANTMLKEVVNEYVCLCVFYLCCLLNI